MLGKNNTHYHLVGTIEDFISKLFFFFFDSKMSNKHYKYRNLNPGYKFSFRYNALNSLTLGNNLIFLEMFA